MLLLNQHCNFSKKTRCFPMSHINVPLSRTGSSQPWKFSHQNLCPLPEMANMSCLTSPQWPHRLKAEFSLFGVKTVHIPTLKPHWHASLNTKPSSFLLPSGKALTPPNPTGTRGWGTQILSSTQTSKSSQPACWSGDPGCRRGLFKMEIEFWNWLKQFRKML